jgi:CheY-like chemotaxis protein
LSRGAREDARGPREELAGESSALPRGARRGGFSFACGLSAAGNGRCSNTEKGLGTVPDEIVVVDDEPDVVRVLQVALTARGYEVHTAGDGVEGLELIRKVRPALAVLDIMMPRMNGYELVQAIRADPELAAMKIVVVTSLTGDSEKTDAEWAATMQVAGFLSKPFETDRLVQVVDSALGSGRQG